MVEVAGKEFWGKKITFSPGSYYQPGLKGAGLVACEEVSDLGLKEPL